jgi:hypothetical protein
MATPTRFSKEDIGGEILPILTTGLYRDPLDAIREYIQNSIDANTATLELIIDPTTVTVSDCGDGMSPSDAKRAIRLGISDKNPNLNIGFRGIGIYSAFNLCNTLEIYTKKKGSRGSRIVFKFGDIRSELLKEQERRRQGVGPKLYLEKLLGAAVSIEDDDEEIIAEHGTRLILSELLSDSYRQLQDWNHVVTYLQNVVPLPFHPNFRYGKTIAKKFEDEDYRVVPLTLQIGARKEAIYRPYEDDLFTSDDEQYSPKFFPISTGKQKYGFAWVCINGRRAIKDQSLRGLLLKKFGFSIGTRRYLDPFFARVVFHNRVTGEIVITNPGILPNAARSDFEHNLWRHEFLEAVASFVHRLEEWANEIQQEDKAREVLGDVRSALTELANELPKWQRDKEQLLKANVSLSDFRHKLRIHEQTIQMLPDLADERALTKKLLENCSKAVTDALKVSKEAQKKVEEDLVKVARTEAKSKAQPRKRSVESPKDLISVLLGCGISLPVEAQRAIRIFENDLLLDHLKRTTYTTILQQLSDLLEEEL